MPPRKTRRVSPATPGKARQYLTDNFTSSADVGEYVICRCGHVLLFYFDNEHSVVRTIQCVADRFGFTPGRSQIESLVKKSLKLYNNFAREGDREIFKRICQEVFVFVYPPPSNPPLTATATAPNPESASVTTPPPSSSSEAVAEPTAPATPPSSRPPLPTAYSDPGPFTFASPAKKLRGSTNTPRKKALKRRLSFLSKEISVKAQTHRRSLKVLRKKIEEMPFAVKMLKQKISRKEKTIRVLKQALKQKTSDKQSSVEIRLLKKKVKDLKQNNEKLKAEHAKGLTDVHLKITGKDQVIKELQNEKIGLEEKVEQLILERQQSTRSSKKDRRTYTVDVRMLVYDMVVGQVPTKNIPVLIKKFSERTGLGLQDVPQRSTVEQMARELGVITELQAAEITTTTGNLTLGFDATTQEGVHMNCIHFTTENDCQVIAIDQLPGGTEDYHNHICTSVDHLAKLYAEFKKENYIHVRHTIIANISNTMTDRAAVNHSTVQKISSTWDKQLNELNCHLHPLDTMASSCRSALKQLESKKGALFGNDCVAANIVLQMNKMRYKDGKGDPKGFVTFLEDNNLPRGVLPRYRGNRLHILFHTCGILIQHFDLFKGFLSTGTVSCGGLQASLLNDFSSETGMKEMCVLGLLGKLLTGPWMTTFYAHAQGTGLDHLSGIQVVKDICSTLAETAKNPAQVFNRTTDFFGNQLDDHVLKAITAFCPRDEEVSDMILGCLDAVLCVLHRQYKKYFELDITGHLQEETKTARLHNIDSEEMMGMFSAAKQRAPNATMCYLSAKLRAVKNHAVQYLDSMATEEKDEVVEWAIHTARRKREDNRLKHHEMKQEMSRRASLQRQKKEEKERKKIETLLRKVKVGDIQNAFPDLEKKGHADLSDILSDAVVGRHLCHIWYEPDSNDQVTYYGEIQKMKKKKSNVCVVSYWKPNETLDDAIDYDMNKFQLAADVVCGDLILS